MIQEFITNHTKFSPSDRAQIIDDAFALSKAGKLYIDPKMVLIFALRKMNVMSIDL